MEERERGLKIRIVENGESERSNERRGFRVEERVVYR